MNGKVVPKEEASLGITDLAILRGYGLFDFFYVKQGHPLFFDDYLDRMERSANILGLPIPLTRDLLKQHIYELIEANGLKDVSLKLVMTGGYAEDGYTPATPNLIIVAAGQSKYKEEKFEKGVKLMLYNYQRTFPAVKTINYIVGVNKLPEMRAAQAEDILFHFDGNIHETVRANFFIVNEDDTIVTPQDDILEGITRKQVLKLAEPNYKVEIRNLSLEELTTAKEAFITSTTKQVMPVVKVDDVVIGNGMPGAVSKHLLKLLREEELAYLSSVAQ